ncbi:MAG TPA: PEP-utilizing enzyme [Candidatus Saccharimonadia bacterium]|nr:PEP-utilizing enzyme [Candidatus Saccharimonadia bacterium]
MSEFLIIAYRQVLGTYFPSIISDEAMTGDKMQLEVGTKFKHPHISVRRYGMYHRFWHVADMVDTRNVILKLQLQHNTMSSFVEGVNQHYDAAETAIHQNLTSSTPHQLWDIYTDFCEEYRNICAYAYIANLIDRPLSEAVRFEIASLKPSLPETQYDRYVLILTRNPYANFLYNFDLGAIRLILDSASQIRVDEHIQKWKTLFVSDGAALSGQDIEAPATRRFESLKAKSIEALNVRQREIESQYQQAEANILQLENELGIPAGLKAKFALIRNSILLKETRKFCMTRLAEGVHTLFAAIGQQLVIEPINIGYLLPSEIETGLLSSKSPLSNEDIEKFKEDFAWVVQNGITKRYIGQSVDKIIARYNLASEIRPRANDVKKSNEAVKDTYKGFVSCLGYAKGPARVVQGPHELAKVRPGDILVTPLTTIEYASVFDKLAGMVTFDGAGITSHPATLSREYKIPAILGIKELDGNVHDDDVISVDATNNEVRIERKVK